MDEKTFNDLMVSVDQAARIENGEHVEGARLTIYFDKTEIQKMRVGLNMTQREFSARFGIPLQTIQDWEQGSSIPDRGAMAFLNVLSKNPDATLQAF
jgi:DNA-binding transcriptional regulator YiaG